MRLVTQDGDGYALQVTVAGETFTVSDRLPAGLTQQKAAELFMEATMRLFGLVEAGRVARYRAAERKAGEV